MYRYSVSLLLVQVLEPAMYDELSRPEWDEFKENMLQHAPTHEDTWPLLEMYTAWWTKQGAEKEETVESAEKQ